MTKRRAKYSAKRLATLIALDQFECRLNPGPPLRIIVADENGKILQRFSMEDAVREIAANLRKLGVAK
jgi:hypothetical protein